MKHDYIDIDPEEIPLTFEHDIEEDTFTFGINYNEKYDFFTLDLWDVNGKPIVMGEKLMLNMPLFGDIVDERLPVTRIIPMDESGEAKRISKDNFYKTVFLCFDDLPDDEFGEFINADASLKGSEDDG